MREIIAEKHSSGGLYLLWSILLAIVGVFCLVSLLVFSEGGDEDLSFLLAGAPISLIASSVFFGVYRSHRKKPKTLIYSEGEKLYCLVSESYICIDPAEIKRVEEVPLRGRFSDYSFGNIILTMNDASQVIINEAGELSEVKSKILCKKFESEQRKKENEGQDAQID